MLLVILYFMAKTGSFATAPLLIIALYTFNVNVNYIDQQAIEHAAKIANLHKFVTNDLPLGYAITVGEHGVQPDDVLCICAKVVGLLKQFDYNPPTSVD